MGDKNPHNSMKKQSIEQQSYLSDDLIIEEILTRLPVKSVLRFKSVSKQWYSTLSSSDFANAHFIKSALPHPCAPVNTLFIKNNNYYIFSYDDDQISGNFEDNLFKLDIDFEDKLDVKLRVGKDYLSVVGSCNGLVCITPTLDKYFIIWNPVTGKLHTYTSDGYLHEPSYRICEARYVITFHGFGYASSVDDYKYVRILAVCFGNETFSNVFLIYSLKENKWRKVEFDHDVIVPCEGAVLINEKLYWSAQCGGDGIVIVSFDLGVEKFDVIKVDLDETDLLGFMGGCLSKCNHDTFMGDKLLHILEPPAVVKSISLPEELRLEPASEMIGFTRTGKFFVTGTCNEEPRDGVRRRTLGVVDTCTTPVQYTMLLRFDKFLRIVRYFPSLVSPFAIGEPSEANYHMVAEIICFAS